MKTNLNQLSDFETERLLLNRLNEHDVDDYFTIFSAEDVAEFDEFTPISKEDAHDDIANILITYQKESTSELELAVRVKNEVGLAGVLYISCEENQLFIGYHFSSVFRGKGYAREAVFGLLNVLKSSFSEHKIVAKVDSENLRSIALLEKCGFVRDETYNKEQYFKEKRHIEWKYELN